MQTSELTFGIEIECFLPAATVSERNIIVGGYHSPIQVPGLPAGWKTGRDGSLHTRKRGMIAMEIVSPILRGREGLEQVVEVYRILNEWGVHTNASCGLHIHVGTGNGQRSLRHNARALKNLVHLVAQFERALFALTGTKRREHGTYAGPVSSCYRAIADLTSVDQAQVVATKFRALNLCPLFSGKRTVEFRVFQGTANVTKVVGYVQVVLGLVARAYAMKRAATWSNGDARYQNGAGLAYFLLRSLNWGKCFKRLGDTEYGVLLPERTDAIKREFKRLAKKYDADTQDYHPALRPTA